MDYSLARQAWSTVYFLAHGEEGKYQRRLIAFAREVGRVANVKVEETGQTGRCPAGE